MACKMVTFYNSAARGNVRQVTNPDNRITVYMPGYQMFQDIRFHIATNSGSHGGGTLQQAYAEEGYPFYPTIPETESGDVAIIRENIIPCIKNIYQMAEYDPVNKVYVDRKPGEWIYDEACRCVTLAEPGGRMNLGDGFVVPNTQEQTDINALMGQSGYTFIQALQKTCPDIIPPVDALGCIATLLKTTSLRWYDIYRSCRADWIVLQSIINPPGTTPPETIPPEITPLSKNILLIGAGLILLIAFTRK